MLTKQQLLNAMDAILFITRTSVLPKLGVDEDIHPVMFLLDDEGRGVGMGSFDLPDDRTSKDLVQAGLEEVIKETGAAGYVVQFMGWAVHFPIGESYEGIRPSQHPDRQEQLLMTAGSTAATVSRSFEAKRKDGKIVELVEVSKEAGGMVGLFQDMMHSESQTRH